MISLLYVAGFNRVKENCTLEIRQVPANMNNIGKLNEHFGKFGSLVNIQVKMGFPQSSSIFFPGELRQ